MVQTVNETMPVTSAVERPETIARWAGIFYLLVIVAPASMLVRSGIVGQDGGTAVRLLAGSAAWRLSVLIDFAGVICYIAVTALLYRLLRSCGRSLAVAAAFLSLAGCIASIVGLLTLWAPLALLEAPLPAGLTAAQMAAIALIPLQVRPFFFITAMSLFGLYCIATGRLIQKASFLPHILGPLMMLSGACYLIYCLTAFLDPASARLLFPAILLPGIIGEGALTLWLLVKGIDVARWHAQNGGAAVDFGA
jgi:hypothetical protein